MLRWTAPNAPANVVCRPERLSKPRSFKAPCRVFVNSMSDMFHPQVPDDFVSKIFDVMNDLPQHTFQVLTKRPERVATWPGSWTPNIWQGASVEDARAKNRIDALRQCGAKTRFISFEPLIGNVGDLNLEGIHWAIVGGESGPGYRPMDHAWARSIRDQCVEQGVAFFFKQDAAFKTETRCYMVEEDGSAWAWQQYPGHLTPPEQVEIQHPKTAPMQRRA